MTAYKSAASRRLAQYRIAREQGDPALIRAASRTALAAADGNDEARALAVVRTAYESLSDDAPEHAIEQAEAEALARMDRRARAALLADPGAAPERPVTVTAAEAAKLPRPETLLAASGRDGAVLSIGEICLLAGAGGVGKSALAGEVALAVAAPAAFDDRRKRDAGGLLDIHGGSGPVLWLAYEEAPGEIGARLAALADATECKEALAAVHILDMRGWPLFGPGERHGASGLYSARPEPLDGWQAMAEAAAAKEPRLIVVDPLLAAYVGEGNAVAPVREFLAALSGLARERNTGVLALAHSTKAARGSRKVKPDPFDPGQIAGSAAWHDGVRGALVLDCEDDPQAGPQRRLAVTKANMGPARILCSAIPRRKGDGSDWIVGFYSAPDGRGWHTPAKGGTDNSARVADDTDWREPL